MLLTPKFFTMKNETVMFYEGEVSQAISHCGYEGLSILGMRENSSSPMLAVNVEKLPSDDRKLLAKTIRERIPHMPLSSTTTHIWLSVPKKIISSKAPKPEKVLKSVRIGNNIPGRGPYKNAPKELLDSLRDFQKFTSFDANLVFASCEIRWIPGSTTGLIVCHDDVVKAQVLRYFKKHNRIERIDDTDKNLVLKVNLEGFSCPKKDEGVDSGDLSRFALQSRYKLLPRTNNVFRLRN